MQIVSVAGHKGGIGKTTLSILLAQAALLAGKRVGLIDIDPQLSLTEWWEQRPEEDPLKVITIEKHEQLEQAKILLNKDYDLLIIDTPPAHKIIINSAVKMANLVVIPCSPSPMDIKGIGETVTLLEKHHKPFFFVLNRTDPRTKIATESLTLLAQHGKVCPTSIGLRIDYAQGMIGGRTPLDVGNKQINLEVNQVYQYLTQQLHKL